MNKHLIWVNAKCSDYYRIISKLQYLNITIYEINYDKKIVHLKIEEKDLEKLQKYLVSYKFKKERNLGIYALLDKIKENHIFVFALIIGSILFFLSTHLIVKINVIHEQKEIRELLFDELKERGVKILTFKKSYEELEKIKQEILDAYPDKLDWLEIETQGMVYNIKVEERIITDTSKESKTCDIVAKKNGTIKDIKLTLGEAVVDLNDYVREGDVLIRGSILHNEEEKRSVCASGEVYAEVWYTINLSIPVTHYEHTKTGKRKFNFVWETNEIKRRILKQRFTDFESSYKPLLKIFDFSLYLESEYETEKKEQKYTEEELLTKAFEKAEESLNKKLSEKDTIIDKKVLKKETNDSTMEVEIFVIVNELISEEKITVADSSTRS